MTITSTALFLILAAGLGIWMWKDRGFKKREFIAVSLFWICLVATPWGGNAVGTVQHMLGTGAQTASQTVNNVGSK
ncbi:hypothetical protein ACFVXW_27075 [Streptomyces sp. NPDC058251]|uniref:hypothetical protein n=1 Tax=Streptomyces sp. NPDC058251 TaxID=3346404 RepID=UPI0036EDBBE6